METPECRYLKTMQTGQVSLIWLKRRQRASIGVATHTASWTITTTSSWKQSTAICPSACGISTGSTRSNLIALIIRLVTYSRAGLNRCLSTKIPIFWSCADTSCSIPSGPEWLSCLRVLYGAVNVQLPGHVQRLPFSKQIGS